MNVLFVNDYAVEIGGAEVLIADERSELGRRGHATEMFSLERESLYGPADKWVLPGQDPHRRCTSLLLQLRHARAASALASTVASFRPDVIHFHSIRRLSPSVLAMARQVPSVVTLHDYGVLYPSLKRLFPRERFCGVGGFACCPEHAGWLRFTFERIRTHEHKRRMCDLQSVLVPSGFMEDVARRAGVRRVVRCPNGAPAPTQRPSRFTPSHAPAGEILYAGRLEREKGVFELLSAFGVVAERNGRARLTFAGEGAAMGELQRRVAASPFACRVSFLGGIRREELATRYAQSRIAVLPSLWPEPFGLVGVEAMLAATPVVGSGRGGMVEWLHDGDNGLVADPEDPVAFGNALSRALDDPVLHARLVAGCKRTAARFELSEHATRLEQIYARAIQSWPGCRASASSSQP